MAKKASVTLTLPPDQEQRDLVRSELDINVLVEAAAGTGKTTSIIQRMLALLRGGNCANIHTMAAVTFTRKAAAELRGRFQVELERAVREAHGEEKENLDQALTHIEQCFIGTIHSFCARLLRERPVEAGVDLAFEEIDEQADQRLREEAWDTFMARLTTDDPHHLLPELHRLGLEAADLKDSFMRFANFPDVDEWPVPQTTLEPEGLEGVLRETQSYISHMAELAPRLPLEYGNDTLIPEYRRLPRVISHYHDLRRPELLMEILELFYKKVKVVQKVWREDGYFNEEDAKNEGQRWERFRDEVAEPALRAWRELRYGTVIRLLQRAQEVYDDLRRERGQLNFQDLLLKAARLLQENPAVRRYFQHRFTHLLVDEFQDTDPIQAEVILLLTASDPGESDWRACVPRPGSLFMVGDPKQSIYRFRRADIVTYNEVKEIISRGSGRGDEGLVLKFSANFRATQPIIEWVNRVFEPMGPDPVEPGPAMLRFPGEEGGESPSYVPLERGREEGSAGEFSGLYVLRIPKEHTSKKPIIDYEADLIARTIRRALDSGITVPRTRQQIEEGRKSEVDPSDFMIVTRNTPNLGVYARKLGEYGIPHRVSGGDALNEIDELRLLHTCLRAIVRPDDPVALVASLRSELFGISDAALYAFKKAGGAFNYHAPLPHDLSPQEAEAIGDAFNRLQTYSRWLSSMPPLAALEWMVADLGLPALAAARYGGDMEAGGLYKALELLRGVQVEMWTTAQLTDYLGRLVEGEERHDAISVRSWEQPAVRIMNLHKVKGLEAPVVFLADPYGEADHPVDRHIDRSGGRIRGYIAVHGKGTRHGPGRLLAHPARWDSLSEKEQGFLRAEALRLRYVAATRSAAATVITQRAKRNNSNPWCHFADHLRGEADLTDPGPQTAPREQGAAIAAQEAREALGAAAARLRQATNFTYDARAAKDYSLSLASDKKNRRHAWSPAGESGARTLHPEGEHGVEWGEAIHLLLQAAMQNPLYDLEQLAQATLAQNGLESGLAPAAAQMARSVMGSPIWQRAQSAEVRLVEVPFQVLLEKDMPLPTILRGAIDLVFKEEDGWVLVDYKTDDPQGHDPRVLAERYRPQVRLYTGAWERCTGQPVKEALLYFIRSDQVVEVTG